MKRSFKELLLMKKRQYLAKYYGMTEEDIPKYRFRKRKHYQSCSPNQHCGCCEAERSWHKTEKRKERYRGKLEIRNEVK